MNTKNGMVTDQVRKLCAENNNARVWTVIHKLNNIQIGIGKRNTSFCSVLRLFCDGNFV